MALPSTIHSSTKEDLTHYSRDHVEQWLPLLGSDSTQRRGEISAPEKALDVQTRIFKPGCVPDKVLIKNGKFQTWFYPSRGLNDLFSRAGPKPDGIKTSLQVLQDPSRTPHLYQRRRSYADTLKMDAGGNGKASGRREDDERRRAPNHGGLSFVGNASDRQPFNPSRNGQLRYNSGHNSRRAYGGYARGWQRQHPGYRFASSRVNSDRTRMGQGVDQQSQRFNQAQRIGGEGGEAQRTPRFTQASQATQADQAEPAAPEVFKNQKAGKAKIDEGSSGEGNKQFCFRCYKPGHGKLECVAKLYCDICGSNEHLTGRCPILKQPRLLAYSCGYDVNGLRFYHIPHAPTAPGK
jgi:hypothetical protein